MGPLGSLVMNTMRMLTPSHIARITKGTNQKDREKTVKIFEGNNTGGIDGNQDSSSQLTHEDVARSKQQHQQKQKEEDNIIEFNKKKKSVAPEQEQAMSQSSARTGQAPSARRQSIPRVSGNNALDAIGIASAREVEEEARARAEAERLSQPSPSVFILEEKEKTRKSQSKLKGQEILQLYNKNIAVDVETDQEDLSESLSSGVLVDKKQF